MKITNRISTDSHIHQFINKLNVFAFFLVASIIGGVAGEFLGIFLVYVSNKELLIEQKIITSLGYIAIPGRFLIQEMTSFLTCSAGGLFFALSIGLGYGFFCGLIFWILSLYQKNGCKWLRPLFLLFFSVLLILVQRGTDFSVTVFSLLVPILIGLISLWFWPQTRSPSDGRFRLAELGQHILLWSVFLIVSGLTLWRFGFIEQDTYNLDFIQIRDRLLLPTGLGQSIDKFYYHYTLYPARIIQPLANRIQKVADLATKGLSSQRVTRLTEILRRYDWFTVQSDGKVNGKDGSETVITISPDNSEELLFYWHKAWPDENEYKKGYKKPVYRVLYQEFLKEPFKHLKKYSESIYPFGPLRTGCGVSLFIIMPVALSAALFFSLLMIVRIILLALTGGGQVSRIREIVAMLLLMLIWFGLMTLRDKSWLPSDTTDIASLWSIVNGQKTGDKIGALQALSKVLKDYHPYKQDIILLARDKDPVIRRFGAEFMGKSGQYGDKEIFAFLVSLLRDPNINVVYTAAGSIGKFSSGEARKVLLDLLTSDQEWYLKMKVYYALKDKGWHQ